MYFCYIDESGNTGNNLKDLHQPYLVLTALLCPPENIKIIEDDIRALGNHYFLAESRNTDFEFHGDDIYSGRSRYLKKLPLTKRLQIFNDLLNIAIKHDSIKLGYISIDKVNYFAKPHIQQFAFSLLVEHLEERLKGSLNSHCLLIADEHDELEQLLIDDLDHFKQTGTHFGYKRVQVDRIIDSVHFVQSKNNFLMQLTDVLCYVIRKGKEAQAKLVEEHRRDNDKFAKPFLSWVENNGHKGNRYFYQSYKNLNSRKPWLFSKDFPR